MRAVLGIGNPGKKYNITRHNIGFMILDAFAYKANLEYHPSNSDYYIAGSPKKASPFILIKPTTFVNLSGIAAKQVSDEFNIHSSELLVISDDVNLSPGKIRVRNSGGDGGHNGLSSIIFHLGTNKFPRLRFGIGNDFEHGSMADYVLTGFTNDEWPEIKFGIKSTIQLIEKFIEGGFDALLTLNSQLNKIANNISNKKNEGKEE
ncbi:MAG: aminoacyl-tRNA hydrolase [Ignavibacteriae bacterium HGW-Ignavibacteriae-2]|nr:MAG: aminoacyl-tRNA hydrolase [Ignavibacteriae bacterium HGW-Ignavibacteriae-2]